MASIEELTRERMKVAAVQPRPVNNAIPGLAAQEMPRTPPEFLQGPRAQAAAPAATRAAPGAALPPPSIAQAPAANAMRRVGGMIPGAAGAAAGLMVAGARQRGIDAPFQPPANQNAPGQIPVDPRQKGPAPVAGRFLNQSEVGRNIGNIAMATLPGRMAGPAITAGLGTVSNAIRAAAPAGRAGAAATQGFALADTLPAMPGRTSQTIADPRTLTDWPGRPGDVQSGRGIVNPPTVAQGPRDGTILKDGNSYSGKDIKFGADIVDKSGKVRNGGTVTSLDMSEGHRQNLLELQRNAAARAGDPNLNRPAMQIGGGEGRLSPQELRERTQGSIADMVVSGKINAQQANAMVGAQEASQQVPIARMRSETDLATNDASNANQRSIAELNSGTNITTAKIGADSRQSAAELAAERRAQAVEAAAQARVQAAEAGAKKYTVVPGGQEVIDIGGFPTTVTRPSRVIDNATGKAVALDGEHGAQQQPAWANDPRVMAIKNSNASMAEKRKQLEALGYR